MRAICFTARITKPQSWHKSNIGRIRQEKQATNFMYQPPLPPCILQETAFLTFR